MKISRLLWFFFQFNNIAALAQESCIFYVYRTEYIFSDFIQANEFQEMIYDNAWQNYFIRINDTVFLDSYNQILNLSLGKRRWIFNTSKDMEPVSCSIIREDTIRNNIISYNDILIGELNSRPLTGKYFTYELRQDSCFLQLEDNTFYLKYLINNDTVTEIKGLPELKLPRERFKSIFLKEDNIDFLGESITTLVFKEIFSNREETIWYVKGNMVPIKKIIKYFDGGSYTYSYLIKIYRF